MDVDIPDDHVMHKKARQVDKLSNDMSQNLHLSHKSPQVRDAPMFPKEQNILVLLENLSKDKEMRTNKECLDNVAQLLQQRFELSAKIESHKSCDNWYPMLFTSF